MKINLNVILGLITVIVLGFLAFSMIKNNDIKTEVIELEDINEELKEEIKASEELDGIEEDNSFDDDVEWFISQLYGVSDRVELYENISPSITEDVTEQLFGEDHPPEEHEQDDEDKSLERKLDEINVYGKFEDERNYVTLVTFDLTFEYRGQTDKAFTIVKVDMRQNANGRWLINDVKEYANK